MNRYTKDGRLSDVIALISFLAVDDYTFRTISKLQDRLNGQPKSAKDDGWQKIAEEHSEFFRFNKARTKIALLIRSYFPEDEEKMRVPLTVAETQKLIDTAVVLQDKEIARTQKNSYLYPVFGSIGVAIITLLGVWISSSYSNRNNSKVEAKIDSVNTKIQFLNSKIDKLNH